MAGLEGSCERQAKLTFAIARHASVDLSHVFQTLPGRHDADRLPPERLAGMREFLARSGVKLRSDAEADERLRELRILYEPYVVSLAHHLRLTVPPWHMVGDRTDNWQASDWEHT